MSLTRSILILAAVAAAMYVAGCLLLFALQRSLIYAPQRISGAERERSFVLRVDGAHVLVSTRDAPGPDAVIYFGGNAEVVSENLPALAIAFPDRALFALHYRGYNGSTGSPSESALIGDALALFDRVHETHSHIVVIGRSLGSGVAIHVASVRPVERLILVTPYDSLQDIAAQRFPLFPVRWMMLDKFESWRYAPQVTAPTLLIAAEYDDVIPQASTELLFKHLPQSLAKWVVIPDAGHNTISDTSEYIPLLRGGP